MKLKGGRKSNYNKNCGKSYRLWNTIWHRFDVPWWWEQLKPNILKENDREG